MRRRGHERHPTNKTGWLRASVLGANDGIVSTASLILGVATAQLPHAGILLSGTAGLVAGAMSMAIGEYVSVHTQADSEAAALDQERLELELDYPGERRELTDIYFRRGLDLALARKVAEQLMQRDALGAHARDELGMSVNTRARPIQAALASAGSFAAGAGIPLLVAAAVPAHVLISATVVASLVCLLTLGGVSAKIGGAPVMSGALRVAAWSAVAMAATAAVGRLLGTPAA